MSWPARRASLPRPVLTACLAAAAASMLLLKLLSGDAEAEAEGAEEEQPQQGEAGCSSTSAAHTPPAAHGLSLAPAEEESAVWTDASSDAAGHATGATPPSQREGLSLQASDSFISALSADDEAFDGGGSNTSSPQRAGQASSPRQAPAQQEQQPQQLVAEPEQHSSTPPPPSGGQLAPQHRRRSSDEQVVFEPVQPLLLGLGGLSLGGWQQQQQAAGGSSRTSAAGCSRRTSSNADGDAAASAFKPGHGSQRDRISWPDGLPSPRPQQQQQQPLQPLNMSAAHAEGQAMTAEQWASVCTVEVGSQQGRAAWAAGAAGASGSSTPARLPSDVVPAGTAAVSNAAAGGKSSSSSEGADEADDLTSEDEADGVRHSSSVSSSTSASSSTSSGEGSGGGSSSRRALALPPDVAAGAGGGGGSSSSAASQQRQQQASTTWAAAAAAAAAPGGQQPDAAGGLRLRHSNSLQPGTLGDWPSLQVSGLSAVWPAAPDLTGGDASKQQQQLPPPSPQRPTAQASGAQQQPQQQPQGGLQRLPSFAADLELQQHLAADVLSPVDATQQQQQQRQQGTAKASLLMEPTLLSTPPARSSSSSSSTASRKPAAAAAVAAGAAGTTSMRAHNSSSSSSSGAAPPQGAGHKSSSSGVAAAATPAPQPAAVLLEAGSQRPSPGVADPPAAAGSSSTPAAAVVVAAADGGSSSLSTATDAGAGGIADGGSSSRSTATTDAGAGAGGSSSAPWLRLVVSAGPAAGKQFQAARGSKEFVIGRSPAAWASIPDAEVSGRHASLAWSDNANCWQLCDAGSLNGTFVNGLSISMPNRQPGCPTSLRHGDQLHLGSTTRARVECSSCSSSSGSSNGSDSAAAEAASCGAPGGLQQQRQASRHRHGDTLEPDAATAAVAAAHRNSLQKQQPSRLSLAPVAGAECRLPQHQQHPLQPAKQQMLHTVAGSADHFTTWHSDQRQQRSSCAGNNQPPPAAACGAGSGSGALLAPARPGGHLSPVILLQFLSCRVQGAVAKMVGADHRRSQCPCEDVVAWRTPLGDLAQLGLFCVFDGHHSRNASEQAQQLLPDLLVERLTARQQQQPDGARQQQHADLQQQRADLHQQPGQSQACMPLVTQQQQQLLDPGEACSRLQQQPVLADEGAVAAALTASFLATDEQLTTDDGCTATALLLEGCADGCVRLRVANVGDSMALLVDLGSAGWRCLTEDHRIAVNAGEAARITAKNALRPGVLQQRFYGLNIARMLGDRYLKEADVGFTAEPFVSEGVALGPCDEALLVVASDGLWDVVAQERVAALAAKAAGEATRASAGAVQDSRAEAGSSGVGARRSVAAVVADELMQAALKLRSRDDISIMVLHVLPAAAAASSAAGGTAPPVQRASPSASGSM